MPSYEGCMYGSFHVYTVAHSVDYVAGTWYRRDRSHMHMRPVTVLEVVRQVSSLLWPYLFGKQPDSLQRDDEVRANFVHSCRNQNDA